MANLLETFKQDISHKADFVLKSDGDLELINGLENLKWALFHRLVTSPGSLVHRPTYGVGIKDFQNSPATLGTQRQLAIRIKEQFELDPRVEEVLGMNVEVNDLTPEKTTIVVRVKPLGYDESTMIFIPFGDTGGTA